MKKDLEKSLLQEQRKGDDDNVIPMPSLKFDHNPPDFDWLRTLPFEARFVSTNINNKTCWFDQWGIGMILPKTILLADFREGGLVWRWVDSRLFSRDNRLVEIIPPPKPEELVKPTGEEDG